MACEGPEDELWFCHVVAGDWGQVGWRLGASLCLLRATLPRFSDEVWTGLSALTCADSRGQLLQVLRPQEVVSWGPFEEGWGVTWFHWNILGVEFRAFFFFRNRGLSTDDYHSFWFVFYLPQPSLVLCPRHLAAEPGPSLLQIWKRVFFSLLLSSRLIPLCSYWIFFWIFLEGGCEDYILAQSKSMEVFFFLTFLTAIQWFMMCVLTPKTVLPGNTKKSEILFYVFVPPQMVLVIFIQFLVL